MPIITAFITDVYQNNETFLFWTAIFFGLVYILIEPFKDDNQASPSKSKKKKTLPKWIQKYLRPISLFLAVSILLMGQIDDFISSEKMEKLTKKADTLLMNLDTVNFKIDETKDIANSTIKQYKALDTVTKQLVGLSEEILVNKKLEIQAAEPALGIQYGKSFLKLRHTDTTARLHIYLENMGFRIADSTYVYFDHLLVDPSSDKVRISSGEYELKNDPSILPPNFAKGHMEDFGIFTSDTTELISFLKIHYSFIDRLTKKKTTDSLYLIADYRDTIQGSVPLGHSTYQKQELAKSLFSDPIILMKMKKYHGTKWSPIVNYSIDIPWR